MNSKNIQEIDVTARPRKLKRVIIREEYVALTGDYKKAVLLHQLEYCQSQAYNLDRYLEEEEERLKQVGDNAGVQHKNGWFQKAAKDLSAETFLNISDSSILIHVQYFIDQGWLQERSNPKQKWDRKKQYRLDLVKLKEDLEAIGYQLEGWAIKSLSSSSTAFSTIENASSKTENGNSETEDRVSVSEEQYINTSSKRIKEHTHRIDQNSQSEKPFQPRKPTRAIAHGVCVKSKYSLEEWLRYVEHEQKAGKRIDNPGALALSLSRSGEADHLMQNLIASVSSQSKSSSQENKQQQHPSSCTGCYGTGMEVVAGKGARRCLRQNQSDAVLGR